ncbi:MAG TPA: radical SAM protein [Deltaproteobacteria bacterium]|nr:radical SAM protein [Deltaproteobacteria bacterium]HQI80080.1 radical SAM protein [Deltaproteobacteria bacterium]
MLVPELDHERIVRMNTGEYSACGVAMKWIPPDKAEGAERLRQDLLLKIAGASSFEFNDTKPVYRSLSPGCRLCGQGAWSCLFISNLCNARCFFCPARQDNQDEPGTSTLTFPRCGDYADYLERFGFKGASISGGEPLLDVEKALSFVSTIKERLGGNIYLWLYTNGTRLTRETAMRLADAGLDEMRFNIAATGYDLTPLRMAVGVIPHVTVEIPAIPEDIEMMRDKLFELDDAGVEFLNLHQIRCTGHNVGNLACRGYTFLHGPQIGILESELTALRLMDHARRHAIGLGINYCSLIYRHRFQARSSRMRWAPYMAKSFEEVTGAGLIRTVQIAADPAEILRVEACLKSRGVDPSLWSIASDRCRMLIAGRLLKTLDPLPAAVKVSYALATVRPGVTYRNPFREVRLASGGKVVIERSTVYPDVDLSPQEIGIFNAAFLDCSRPVVADAVYRDACALDPSGELRHRWRMIVQAETLRSGLLEYY